MNFLAERLVGDTGQHVVPLAFGVLLDSAEDLRKKRVQYIRYDHADGTRGAAAQVEPYCVGPIMPEARVLPDPVAGGFADFGTAVERLGNGGNRDSKFGGNLLKCRAFFHRGSKNVKIISADAVCNIKSGRKFAICKGTRKSLIEYFSAICILEIILYFCNPFIGDGMFN